MPDADRFRPEADVAVEDASADYESYTDRFYLVAEVISDNNTTRQIAVKRRHYMAHPDNQYCMIIAQKKVSVELRSRASDRRRTMLTSLDDTLSFSAFGFVMPVAALYTGTPLAKRPAPPAR